MGMNSRKLFSKLLGIKEEAIGFIRYLPNTHEIHYSTSGGYNTTISVDELRCDMDIETLRIYLDSICEKEK